MATNWVKDGLDAYLSLTGEKRAQDKAESDKAYQDQQMTLAKNADTRAEKSAGLNNQLAGLQVEEATVKSTDRKSVRERAFNYVKFKQMAALPGLDDTEGIAAAETEAHDLLATYDMTKKMPAGRVPLSVPNLPPSAQRSIMSGPYIAAQQRAGQKHSDAQGEYTMTGELGNVYVEKAEDNGPAIIVPTMTAVRADGTTIEVPFTPNRTNKGDENVTVLTSEQVLARGATQLTAIANAKKNGTHPAEESAAILNKMFSTMTDDEIQKWMADDRTKAMTRAETAQYDESVAKAAAPYVKLVSELKGTASEKETQFLSAIKGAPRAVVAYLKDNAEVSSKLFEPAAKREDAKLKAEEDRQVRSDNNKRDNSTRLAIAEAIRSGKESPNGLKAREALSSVDKDIKELHVDNRALRKDLRDADAKGRVDIQASIDANDARMKELNEEKSTLLGRKAPAEKGLDVVDDHTSKVSGAKAMLSGAGTAKKPYMNAMQNQIMGLGGMQ